MADSKTRNRSRTEAAIVEAAERLLVRDGFPGLNIQTLAAEAGHDRKLVYRYFEDIEGVVARLAPRALAELVKALDAAPKASAQTQRGFARESLSAWLQALRQSPLTLRLMAWALTADSTVLRKIEAERSALLQAWMRERRPRLKAAPEGDPLALNAVLMGAVQQLALASVSVGTVGGLSLDDAGWTRAQSALDDLLVVFSD